MLCDSEITALNSPESANHAYLNPSISVVVFIYQFSMENVVKAANLIGPHKDDRKYGFLLYGMQF